jgi:hypothetical protein
MATYGRNLTFRIPPQSENRQGRFSAPASTVLSAPTTPGGPGVIPIGAPVTADLTAGADALGCQVVKLAAQAAAPIGGQSGIAVYEYGPAAFAGFDPLLTTYSDLGTVVPGKALQVVSGPYVKVVFANTVAEQFLMARTYPGRIMVAGLTAVTPGVTVGQYLVPGQGDDVDGYWQAQSSITGAWLVVTSVDTVRVQVEARMLF